jgi:hypothetical protein
MLNILALAPWVFFKDFLSFYYKHIEKKYDPLAEPILTPGLLFEPIW